MSRKVARIWHDIAIFWKILEYFDLRTAEGTFPSDALVMPTFIVF